MVQYEFSPKTKTTKNFDIYHKNKKPRTDIDSKKTWRSNKQEYNDVSTIPVPILIPLPEPLEKPRLDIDSKKTWRSNKQECDNQSTIPISISVPVEKKTLIVLELAGTLCWNLRRDQKGTYQIDEEYIQTQFRANNYLVYLRPGAEEILKYLVNDYGNVAIWTTMQEENAKAIIKKLGEKINIVDLESKFKFIWYRSKCQPDPENGVHATIKNVQQILDDPEINPHNLLSESDILIYDDNEKSQRYNPIIPKVETFDVSKPNDRFLYELLDRFKNGNF
jgi:hypothetical protein